MLNGFLKRWTAKSQAKERQVDDVFQVQPPALIEVPGADPLHFAALLQDVNGLVIPDWQAVAEWVTTIAEPTAQSEAWAQAELAWLAHLQAALGPRYHLAQHEYALLLSALEPRVAAATVQFMTKTLSRIEKVLDGIAQSPVWGKDILVVFDDEETYYRYVSRYYPDDGEFAFSGGMHINAGCSHFVTFQAELRTIEPVIAHEMTHGCLRHLPIPAWLNEGLAVNTERRLCPPLAQQYTPQQLHWMLGRFWTEDTIQEFWSGKSFLRPDEGNLLSYELARILTDQFARDWGSFTAFVNQANLDDAGHGAAKELLGVDLGGTVCALLGFEPSQRWAPDPKTWENEPERGAF